MTLLRLINYKPFAFSLFLILSISKVDAQLDSNYVTDYSHWLTTRLYSVSKFNRLTIGGKDNSINYFPNNNINIGLGYTYRGFGINLGFKAPFINQDDDKKGETNFLDIQANLFNKKIAVNFAFQYFRGYYLTNPDKYYPDYWNGTNNFPSRRDLRTLNVNLSGNYIFNSDRFSYRSIFIQDQLQKKSAGSFLVGIYTTFLWLGADSGLANYNNQLQLPPELNVDYASTFSIGPQAGYAYTFVLWDNFFISLSLVLGAGYNYTSRRQVNEDKTESWSNGHSVGFKAQHRVGIGYNSEKYFIGANYSIGDYFSVFDNRFILIDAGNIRFNFVRRFNHQPKFLNKVTDFVRYKVLHQKDE